MRKIENALVLGFGNALVVGGDALLVPVGLAFEFMVARDGVVDRAFDGAERIAQVGDL